VLVYGRDIKLADFTLSVKCADAEHRFSHVSYTVTHRAPEILLAQLDKTRGHDWGMSADIWALGCVFFELAYKYPPFAYQQIGNDAQATETIARRTFSHIASIFPELSKHEQYTAFPDLSPIVPWPTENSGDEYVQRFVRSMIRPKHEERCTAHELVDMCDTSEKVAYKIFRPAAPPLLLPPPAAPAGTPAWSDFATRMYPLCSGLRMAEEDILAVLVVVELKIAGHSGSPKIREFYKTHRNTVKELALLKHVDFRILF
jgi:serine/threonine protein kinase